MAPERTEYLGINLTRKVKKKSSKQHCWMKLKRFYLKNGEIYKVHGLADSILLKWQFLQIDV